MTFNSGFLELAFLFKIFLALLKEIRLNYNWFKRLGDISTILRLYLDRGDNNPSKARSK